MPRTTSTISAIILSRGNRAAGGIAALHLAEMASRQTVPGQRPVRFWCQGADVFEPQRDPRRRLAPRPDSARTLPGKDVSRPVS
jgi:hypothetical protein